MEEGRKTARMFICFLFLLCLVLAVLC
uniref:Uncharacterized protein n=1 Tax=Rhizophora mucronata TaxID=61149 RepID=A0A2P2R2Q5_RHIMU